MAVLDTLRCRSGRRLLRGACDYAFRTFLFFVCERACEYVRSTVQQGFGQAFWRVSIWLLGCMLCMYRRRAVVGPGMGALCSRMSIRYVVGVLWSGVVAAAAPRAHLSCCHCPGWEQLHPRVLCSAVQLACVSFRILADAGPAPDHSCGSAFPSRDPPHATVLTTTTCSAASLCCAVFRYPRRAGSLG